MTRTSDRDDPRRHRRPELWFLGLIGALVLIPWLIALATGLWFLAGQGWAWYWWAASVLFWVLAFVLLRLRRPPPMPPRPPLAAAAPGASAAEQQARLELQRIAAKITADDLNSPEQAQQLMQGAFHAVALAYSPGDRTALWRFTVPELLLMVEDLARRVRATVLAEFPVMQHVELSLAVRLLGIAAPAGELLGLWRLLRWVDPARAMLAELSSLLSSRAFDGLGAAAKAQIAVILFEQAGKTAVKLYSGGYRRRADELLPTAPTPIPEASPEPLTVVIAGRRNAGKSALLNTLLGKAREQVGLLTAATVDCRAYKLQSAQAGTLMLVDCPGSDGTAGEPWLAQAAKSDLVLWVADATRADRAADQRALVLLDELTAPDRVRRAVPRLLVLTHADRVDPPREWRPPYDLEHGTSLKEQQMREARLAACEQLQVPIGHCALLAIRPGEPLWNGEALEQAIYGILPEAQQKQLERGLAKDGWFRVVMDAGKTLPGTYDKVRSWTEKTLRRAVNKALGKGAATGP